MSFGDALERHLRAIQERDLEALADTIATDDIVLIMADGKLARTRREFLDAHRGWLDNTLVFQRRGKWLVVQDRDTPIR